jgi:hypothetical protein
VLLGKFLAQTFDKIASLHQGKTMVNEEIF